MVTCNEDYVVAIKKTLAKDHPYKACPKCFDNIRRYSVDFYSGTTTAFLHTALSVNG